MLFANTAFANSSNGQQLLNNAQSALQKDNISTAANLYEQYLAGHPNTESSNEVRLLLGQCYYVLGRERHAFKMLNSVMRAEPNSGLAKEAERTLSIMAKNKKPATQQPTRSQENTPRVVVSPPPKQTPSVDDDGLPNAPTALLNHIDKTSDSKLAISVYEKFIKNFRSDPRRAEIMVALSAYYLDAKEFTHTERVVRQFYSEYPNHKLTQWVNNVENNLNSARNVNVAKRPPSYTSQPTAIETPNININKAIETLEFTHPAAVKALYQYNGSEVNRYADIINGIGKNEYAADIQVPDTPIMSGDTLTNIDKKSYLGGFAMGLDKQCPGLKTIFPSQGLYSDSQFKNGNGVRVVKHKDGKKELKWTVMNVYHSDGLKDGWLFGQLMNCQYKNKLVQMKEGAWKPFRYLKTCFLGFCS